MPRFAKEGASVHRAPVMCQHCMYTLLTYSSQFYELSPLISFLFTMKKKSHTGSKWQSQNATSSFQNFKCMSFPFLWANETLIWKTGLNMASQLSSLGVGSRIIGFLGVSFCYLSNHDFYYLLCNRITRGAFSLVTHAWNLPTGRSG